MPKLVFLLSEHRTRAYTHTLVPLLFPFDGYTPFLPLPPPFLSSWFVARRGWVAERLRRCLVVVYEYPALKSFQNKQTTMCILFMV